MGIIHAQQAAQKIKENVARVIVSKEETVELLLVALLSGGHVLLEDVPGTGKTMLAKSMARSMDMDFHRIQFTPDLLPSDVTGMNIYNQKEGEFVFRKGPVFSNILLADEINRATPRSQSALLEVMEEAQVSSDGVTYPLPQPFMVIATQNPIETQGTFPLPEAQLDRFLLKLSMGYPAGDEGVGILERFILESPLEALQPVVGVEEILQARDEVRTVRAHKELLGYIVALAEFTREADGVLLGASPRATIALMRASQALAAIRGRDYLLPDDVKAVAPHVLTHRIICRNQYASGGKAAQNIVNMALTKVKVPSEALEDMP